MYLFKALLKSRTWCLTERYCDSYYTPVYCLFMYMADDRCFAACWHNYLVPCFQNQHNYRPHFQIYLPPFLINSELIWSLPGVLIILKLSDNIMRRIRYGWRDYWFCFVTYFFISGRLFMRVHTTYLKYSEYLVRTCFSPATKWNISLSWAENLS